MSNRTNTLKTLEKQFLPKAKGKQKERVREFLDLYKDGKIFSKVTIQRELNRYLGRTFKNEDERESYYDKATSKYSENPTVVQRREVIKNEPKEVKAERKLERNIQKDKRDQRREIRVAIKKRYTSEIYCFCYCV